MSSSYSFTETWSRTHARKVGGKVVSDLRQMQQEYGFPSDSRLEEYLTELVVLLDNKILREVTYGFRRNNVWIVALRYTADMNGNLTADDRSGRVPRGVDISGASWGSYLEKSLEWSRLTPSQKQAIERELPFEREGADEPSDGQPPVTDKTYSGAGSGVRRSVIGGAY